MIQTRRTILCVGASHQTASLASRERFALDGPRGRELCASLAADPLVDELVAIATCNRSEVYVLVSDVDAAAGLAVQRFAELAQLEPQELATLLVVRVGDAAVEHLFRVSAGIESVVTGEAQIQGQVRTAHEQARERGTCGAVLDRLFRRAVEVGKRARSETRISEGHASIGSVAAELVADQRGGTLDGARVVVVGAGKMGGLAARSLAARGATRVDVANRSVERACAVVAASGVDGEGVPFSELDDELVSCDVLVSCTNAPHQLIGSDRIQRAMRARQGRQLVLVDLAVPRDIEPECGAIAGVHAFDLDDLERVVAQTLDVRSDEVAQVQRIARDATVEFSAWMRAERATPRIRAMREHAEQLRRDELANVLDGMPHLSDEDRSRIDELTRSIVNRVLHEQTLQLRSVAEQLR